VRDSEATAASSEEPLRRRLEDRFREDVKPDRRTGCLIWTGAVSERGCGQIQVGSRTFSAHRAAYELACGPIPNDFLVRRTCHNPLCVNPEHLKAGTYQDNVDDLIAAGRTQRTARKLTQADAVAIWGFMRLRWPRQDIADRFQVSLEAVQTVLNARSWPTSIENELIKEKEDTEVESLA
jgi:HNH endonuclease